MSTIPPRTALVLAGGGLAGLSWELGVLQGITEVNPDLASAILRADVVVGTSAGSAVGAQITSGTPLEDLYAAQFVAECAEIEVTADLDELSARVEAARAGACSPEDAARRIGTIALTARTVDPVQRLAAIAARLPATTWPDRPLRISAVDATSGDVIAFDRGSEVSLVLAVAASCAVPGIWPPVEIAGRLYIDGGVTSITHADLAVGANRLLILRPSVGGAAQYWGGLDQELAQLRSGLREEVHSLVIDADAASAAAFGPNPFSPAIRRTAALAGRDVGRSAASSAARFWWG